MHCVFFQHKERVASVCLSVCVLSDSLSVCLSVCLSDCPRHTQTELSPPPPTENAPTPTYPHLLELFWCQNSSTKIR